MSLFTNEIDKRAQETYNRNPFVQTGYVIDSVAVSQSISNNAVFKGIVQMDKEASSTPSLDSISTGISIGLKNPSSPTRKEVVYVNPKFADAEYIGTTTGKKPVISSDSKGMLQADVIFSGGNKQTPTIVGMQFTPSTISDTVTVTRHDVANNVNTGGASTGANSNPANNTKSKPENDSFKQLTVDTATLVAKGNIVVNLTALPGLITRFIELSKRSLTLQNILRLPKDKNKTAPDNTQRGVLGQNIRTGTTWYANMFVKQATSAIPFMEHWREVL